jgi:hypothetical protein
VAVARQHQERGVWQRGVHLTGPQPALRLGADLRVARKLKLYRVGQNCETWLLAQHFD